MKHVILILIATFSFVLLETVESQSPITFTAHLSVDDYLKDRQINKIDRDDSGIFWLLENSVIQKYDGRYVTEKIPHRVNSPKYFKCLQDNSIILISNELEIFLLDKEEKELTPFTPEVESCDHCSLTDINLIEDVIYLYYRDGETINVYASDPFLGFQKVDHFTSNFTQDITSIFKVDSTHLIITKDEKVYHLSDDQSVEMALSPYFREVNAAVISNYVSPNELYFSLPRRNGTYRYKEGVFDVISEVEKLAFAKKDRKGKVLVACSRSFLHSEEIKVVDGDSIYSWPELAKINDTYIDAYVEDVDDKILLGSHTGLFFVDMTKKGIKSYHKSNTSGSFGNVIMSFTQVPNGDIYYVKENKGIFKFEGLEQPQSLPVSGQLLNNLNCRYDSTDQQIWVSGYTNERQGVLYSYNFMEATTERHDFDMPVMYFQRFTDDELLISSSISTNSKILRYNTKTKEVEDTLLDLNSERSRRFEFHSPNELLIGTDKRLLLYDFSNQAVSTILPETAVQTIVKTSKGYGICTIGKGILFMDSDLKVIKVINESNGLTNNQVYSLTEDTKGRFWAGTGKGLIVLDENFQYIRSFRTYDGIASYELNTNSAIILDNGKMLFGTIDGLTEIDPELALSSPESSVLNIPEIFYTNDEQRVTQKVSSNQISIPVSSSNIGFILEQNDFYKYTNTDNPIVPRIQILPEETVYELKENRIIIPQLESKNTRLNVFPSNPLKASNKITLTLTQKKNYQALILFISLISLIALLSYFTARKIIRFNERRESERRANEVKMAELELQALRSQMNPHFIFNSLGAILLYLQTHENKKAEKYLTKFAKLMRMFLESSKSKFISFAEEKKLLELYLDLEKLRFENKFQYHFDIDSRIDTNTLALPSMILQPFVENSINHGLYHKKSNDGILSIRAIPDGGNVKVIIKDNGIGRERSQEIQMQSLKKHRSRATEIIQERLQVLKTEKNIDIDIEYNDLIDENGLSSGTEVIITLPKMIKEND